MTVEPFSDDENAAIIHNCLLAANGGLNAEDFDKIFDWAHMTRVNARLLELLLDGKIGVRVRDDGETVFYAIDETAAYSSTVRARNYG